MQGFKTNNCRLCVKVFCCKKCRLKHEINFHKIIPECDLCIYGKWICDNNIEETLSKHLEESHFPLNCVCCRKVFSCIEEIFQHKKCRGRQFKADSPNTPFRQEVPALLVSSCDQDSPILQELQRKEALNYIFYLATSTPMQRGQEPNIMFEKINKEPVTPVDQASINVINKSIIKKTDSVKSENSSKRRVTFSETPGTNSANKDLNSDHKNVILSKDTEFSNQKFPDSQLITPVTGSSTGQFYSAKSESEPFFSAKSEGFLRVEREKISEASATEGSTPVCTPILPKMIAAKGDIYKTQNLESSYQKSSNVDLAVDKNESQDTNSNLNEVSMELCTPAKPANQEVSDSSAKAEIRPSDISSQETNDYDSKLLTPLCTPGNPGKIVIKGAMYQNSELESNQQTPVTPEITSETKGDISSNKEDNSENNSISKDFANDNATVGNTLWLSAMNLNESTDSEESNDENKNPNIEEPVDKKSEIYESPSKPTRRRVSIVMPTPILKRTDFKMKFHIPAHFASTPIMSSGVVKMKQTKIVEEISTRVINPQTPFKTPQGHLSEFAQRRFVRSNIQTHLDTFGDIEVGPSSTRNEFAPLSDVNANNSSSETNSCKELTKYHSNFEDQDIVPVSSGVSVGSMTESNLWTSMTRIVKSVLGLTNDSQESNMSTNNNSTSFKRHLSDPESSGDFLEAPRLKRFKFADIKCRRPIRNLPALLAPSRLALPPTNQGATFEIVKSVSTLYGGKGKSLRIQCDKATQTDNYLMYGWHAQV